MFSRSSWLHLRIPFSYFLLPIFLFSLTFVPNLNGQRILWVFIILHFLLYPASNAYNSYFDKDEKSIGGLKNPPPVDRGLYWLAILFDVLAIVLGLLKVNLTFAVMLLIYGLVSKAYSHPAIRLKKYAITSWLITGFFQGVFTFVMCYVGLNDFPIESALRREILVPAFLTCLMLWANYPMTQIYQHEEDSKRGDRTLSILLGIRGTFVFTAVFFSIAIAAFLLFFQASFDKGYSAPFLLLVTPIAVYFFFWFYRVIQDPENADYRHTMFLNLISSTCLNIFFIFLFLDSTHVIQAIQGGFGN